MDREQLYEKISRRKANPRHAEQYRYDNGRINRFLDLVRDGSLPRGGWVVDVGGSHGDLVEASLREGLFDQGTVLDISMQSVEVARDRGLDAVVIDIDNEPMCGRYSREDEHQDAVVALDFIEHIVDPENFARECAKVLRPGGYVFINTPNIQYWEHLEELVLHGRFPHTSGDTEVYHGGHLAFYNENDIERIFRPAGFNRFEVFMASDEGKNPSPLWTNLFKESDPVKKYRMLSCPNLMMACYLK